MRKRIVITGLGIVSCLGNDADTVSKSLYEGRSGITANKEQIDIGMRSHVSGSPIIDIEAHIDRKKIALYGQRSSLCLYRDAAGNR